MLNYIRIYILTMLATLLAISSACGVVDVPSIPEIPDIPGLPGSLEEVADQVPGLLEELQLPDLSGIPGLPDLSDLPVFTSEPGVLNLQGPTERAVDIGQQIPGTDIQLISINEQGAVFQIAGLTAQRKLGDSLDFDGSWPGIEGVAYSLRMRVYRIGSQSVRAAGVHQLIVRNIQPVKGQIPQHNNVLRVPFTISAATGEDFKGLTYRYLGSTERGAEFGGLSEGEYPFRKSGDSLVWEGTLRNDIPARFNLRVLFYGEGNARLGGTVALYLPNL